MISLMPIVRLIAVAVSCGFTSSEGIVAITIGKVPLIVPPMATQINVGQKWAPNSSAPPGHSTPISAKITSAGLRPIRSEEPGTRNA